MTTTHYFPQNFTISFPDPIQTKVNPSFMGYGGVNIDLILTSPIFIQYRLNVSFDMGTATSGSFDTDLSTANINIWQLDPYQSEDPALFPFRFYGTWGAGSIACNITSSETGWVFTTPIQYPYTVDANPNLNDNASLIDVLLYGDDTLDWNLETFSSELVNLNRVANSNPDTSAFFEMRPAVPAIGEPTWPLWDVIYPAGYPGITPGLVAYKGFMTPAMLPYTTVDGGGGGGTGHPNVMLWTFELDGHEYLVAPLQDETLIYDFLMEQWYVWGNGVSSIWAPQHGQNWNANLGTVINALGGDQVSNVICGDNTTGALYFLDPELNEDYSNAGVSGQPFQRVITGQLLSRTSDYTPLAQVEVAASDGEAVTINNPTVDLQYSDDRGYTYSSFGARTVIPDEFGIQLQWRSLGGYRTPGRLLKLIDYGALVRVDDWTVPDDG